MHRAHTAYSVCLSPARQPKLSQWLAQKTSDKTKVRKILFSGCKLKKMLRKFFWFFNFRHLIGFGSS